MVQTQVTAQGCLGSTPEGRRPQIRGWRAGGALAVSSPTPATPLLSPAKIRELNHAACRAARFPRVNEHTPAHRRSAWATRGLASHNRVAKDPPHDPDIHSLRQCHAMLRPRTLVRGNEIFGKTDHSAPVEDQTVQGEPEVHARSDDRDPL